MYARTRILPAMAISALAISTAFMGGIGRADAATYSAIASKPSSGVSCVVKYSFSYQGQTRYKHIASITIANTSRTAVRGAACYVDNELGGHWEIRDSVLNPNESHTTKPNASYLSSRTSVQLEYAKRLQASTSF